jgi:hypothetical protein
MKFDYLLHSLIIYIYIKYYPLAHTHVPPPYTICPLHTNHIIQLIKKINLIDALSIGGSLGGVAMDGKPLASNPC